MSPQLILISIFCFFVFELSGQTTLCQRISSSTDDVEESGNDGDVYTNSSDIELTFDDFSNQGNQIIGLRYPSLQIPAGAIITNAYLQFTADETNSGPCNLLIKGEDVDNSSAFVPITNNVSNRTTTSAAVSWSPANWTSTGENGANQKSPDLKTIIQEIIDRNGYNEGNAISLIITGTGERTAESYDGDPSSAAQLCVTYVSAEVNICAQITSSLNDVEQHGNNGSIYTNSTDIELVSDGSRGNQIIGLRYTTLQIPQGAIISNAYLQFTTDETNSGACNLSITGEDVNNSAAFSTTNNNVSNRTTTTSSVSWSPANWTSVGESGPDQKSPDLKTILQEIVDRPGYSSGNAISLIISGTGERTAESYDGAPSSAAKLCVKYELPALTWTAGAANDKTDWFNGDNWSQRTPPLIGNDVVIPTNPAGGNFFPDINASNANCNNLLIETGAELSISGSNAINLFGSWDNNGSFNANQSTVNFIGSVVQSIEAATTQSFYNITLNNINGLVISTSPLNLNGTLTLTNGSFNTNNLLTLISNTSGTASIAAITGGSITGNITMQRYIDAGATNWRFITSAVSGASLASFNDDFETSGYPGSGYPDWPSPTNPWPSIYGYDETEAGDKDVGFNAVSNASNIMSPGEGFWVWCGDTITGTQPFTFDITGSANTGNINLPISYTNTGNTDDGWNMTGNPYPSALDWDSPDITKTNINNAIYIWNPDNQQFASYVSGFGTNGGSRYIASSQAFWVQAIGAGTAIEVTESAKSAQDAAYLKQNSIAPLRIITQNTYGSDELIINLQANASNSFDALYDAEKIPSSNTYLPNTSSVLNGLDYSINQFNPQEISIPIKILSGATGIHSIDIENAIDFNPSSCLILEDLFTGTSYDLRVTTSFSTTIYDTTQTARFLLHLGAPVKIEPTDISCFGNNDAKIVYAKNSNATFDITWKDNLNNIITANSNILFTDSITNLSQGIYYIETTDTLCGNSTDTVTVDEPAEILSAFISDSDTTYLAQGGNVNFTNLSNNATNYFWDFGDFNTSSLSSPAHQYTNAGTYTVTLNASQSNNCYNMSSQNIIVIDDITTAIPNQINKNQTKVWIRAHKLNIEGNEIISIAVSNILGQTLYHAGNKKQYVFDLSKLNSQVLIVNVSNNGISSATKVNFIKF